LPWLGYIQRNYEAERSFNQVIRLESRGAQMVRGLQGWHLIIVVVVFVVLFGAKKLPDSAKSIAKSLKIFKNEMKNGDEKGDTTKSDS
jgi:TatA/E family protein of Tat protein translocase